MRCPRCNQEAQSPYTPCTHCGFSGPPGEVEELAHLRHLLREIESWGSAAVVPAALLQRYTRDAEALEITLGLRRPVLALHEVRQLRWEIYCLDGLQELASFWLERHWVGGRAADQLCEGARKRTAALQERLVGAPPATAYTGAQDRLKRLDYLKERLEQAYGSGHFVDERSHAAAQADLLARRDKLETEAGLRPRAAEAVPAPVPAVPAVEAAPAAAPAAPPAPPRPHITWEQVWQTLLSRRTLNVLLFLGAFLLVASAAYGIVYNWDTLPDWAQLLCILLPTALCYLAGWYLRARLKLRASGIAVTAVASLLVPLDVLAVAVVGEAVPQAYWPWVWLVTSALCLVLYAFTALRIRAEFFGYLVTVAAANLLCAALRLASVPTEWWLAALVGLALGLEVVGVRLRPAARAPAAAVEPRAGEVPQREASPETQPEATVPAGVQTSAAGAWALLSTPFRFSALVSAVALLLAGIGWWIARDLGPWHLGASLAAAWALGAVLFAYAAACERSPLLGHAAAAALPVALCLTLRLAFEPWEVKASWYALGLAALSPAYLWLGHRLLSSPSPAGEEGRAEAASPSPPGGEGRGEGETRAQAEIPPSPNFSLTGKGVEHAHGRTATGWGLALMAVAAGWAVFDPAAAAATHAVLAGAMVEAVTLWRKPRALPAASLLALSSVTFAMAALHLAPAELCLGWAALALVHVLAAIGLRAAPDYAARLFAAALAVDALALLPPLAFGHAGLLTYALGQWLVLAGWLAWLDRRGRDPGLAAFLGRLGPLRPSALHWAIALPLPFFAAVLYTCFRPADAWLGLVVAGVGWLCFLAGRPWSASDRSLSAVLRRWSLPWSAVAYGCSIAGPALAFYFYQQLLLAGTALMAALLYFGSAWAFRSRWWLVPAGWTLPASLLLFLDSWAVPWPRQGVVLAGVAAAYLLGGTALERWRGLSRAFFAPLNAVAHALAAFALACSLVPAFQGPTDDRAWLRSEHLWAVAAAAILAVTYGLLAWLRGEERWAHAAAWLGVLAAATVVSAYDLGPGSPAFLVALLAALYVLAERALAGRALRRRGAASERLWSLFRRPLLIAGWAVSGGAVALAIGGTLGWFGAGRELEVPALAQGEGWAIVALLAVTALYAVAAWLFRRRFFLWLAGALLIVPWTLLTSWGWFVWPGPVPLPHYALAWAALASLELAVGLGLTLRSRKGGQDYGYPLRTVAHLLLPTALFWGVADSAVSSITWGLGAACYLASAAADHLRGLSGWRAARFLYPAVAIVPAWAVYLLNVAAPRAPYEAYGLTLLCFSLPLLLVGRLLRRFDPADGLPLYLGAYGAAVVGTLLVAHRPPYLTAALGYDTALCVLSAWIFREPMWGFPAAALAPVALLTGLSLSPVPPERRGWCLIGLGAIDLLLAWLLRRGRWGAQTGRRFSVAPLAAAFAVVALGLSASSQDLTGAFWGYLAGSLLYAVAAAWLRQPLLLWATAALASVPYGVGVVWLGIQPAGYGLAVFPGVAAALALAHVLDGRLPPPRRDSIPDKRPGTSTPDAGKDSPARAPGRMAGLLASLRAALAPRAQDIVRGPVRGLADRWAAAWYAWAYVGALVAVGLSWTYPVPLSVALALAAGTFLHAAWRFRSRLALLASGALAQGAVLAAIDASGWLEYPAWAALAFLPVTVVTAALALTVELKRHEGSPLGPAWAAGWSRPFYLLLAADLLGGQIAALAQPEPGAVVTAVHAGLLAVLATVWAQRTLPFLAAALGTVALFQGAVWAGLAPSSYPVAVALLALAYGLAGYGLRALPRAGRRAQIWQLPLEWGGLALSAVALVWTAAAGLDLAGSVGRALLGRPVARAAVESQMTMVVWVLAILGVLYLTAAVARRWWLLGYGAVAMILVAWAIWWRFSVTMSGFQWYAVPVMLYLLGIGSIEWRRGHRRLARWVDRTAMLIGLGSAWLQSIPGVMDPGWPYALLLGVEALGLLWWGSARRRKEFLYVGMAAVIVDAVTQTIGGVFSPYRWLVLGLVGLLLVGLAVLVERRLERIRELSAELRERLEGWD